MTMNNIKSGKCLYCPRIYREGSHRPYILDHINIRERTLINILRRSLRYFQEHQIKNRRGGPIHLMNRTVEKQEWRLIKPERPGELFREGHTAAERRPVRSRRKPTVRHTLPVLSKEPLQRTRRTTGGAEEYGDRQPNTEQPQEKDPQCGSIGRRSGR
ncbi:hypothetical protein TNCV_1773871 [Trichonephila clavipes]|nr:hypothetical protein TNCV_1773871 [Trichonephila clavipes]